MRKFFGTDGIRGEANQEPLTPQTITHLAQATGKQFLRGNHKHLVIIGKDTRISGYMLESALVAGFVSVGMDVSLIGPLPTPAVSMLTRSMRADLGVMISASHNPYKDNGIKLFGPNGYKLSDSIELEIEERLNNPISFSSPNDLGQLKRIDDAPGRYVEFVKNTVSRKIRLDGLNIVLDCANGAAYKVAPTVLKELGANLIPIAVNPNGYNINDSCGTTHPQLLQKKVIEAKADIGIALDGDADRVIFSDEKGNLIDGDQIIALIATDWANRNILKNGGIVTTVMSNLGLEHYLTSIGLSLIRTAVGDRYVSKKMKEGYNLGGEQSGHVILSDYSAAGDGLLTALQVLSIFVQSQKLASKLLKVFQPVPQILKNVHLKTSLLKNPEVQKVLEKIHKTMGSKGRLLIRPSGTEPVIRVMVEADHPHNIENIANDVINELYKYDKI